MNKTAQSVAILIAIVTTFAALIMLILQVGDIKEELVRTKEELGYAKTDIKHLNKDVSWLRDEDKVLHWTLDRVFEEQKRAAIAEIKQGKYIPLGSPEGQKMLGPQYKDPIVSAATEMILRTYLESPLAKLRRYREEAAKTLPQYKDPLRDLPKLPKMD